jgi:hypothetical protein
MGKIVMSATAKRLFKSMAQALRQMLGCRTYGKLMATPPFRFHNASQRIVLGGPFGFVIQKLLDLFLMRDEKVAIQIDKSTRLAAAYLLTRWAKYLLLRTPVSVLFVH